MKRVVNRVTSGTGGTCPAACPPCQRNGARSEHLTNAVDGWEPGGPWDAQSDIVKELVDARDKLWMSGLLRSRYLTNHPQNLKLEKASL